MLRLPPFSALNIYQPPYTTITQLLNHHFTNPNHGSEMPSFHGSDPTEFSQPWQPGAGSAGLGSPAGLRGRRGSCTASCGACGTAGAAPGAVPPRRGEGVRSMVDEVCQIHGVQILRDNSMIYDSRGEFMLISI